MFELFSGNAGIDRTGIYIEEFSSKDFAFFGIASFTRIFDEFFVRFVAFFTHYATIDTAYADVSAHS